jgi:16S rRNA (guanine(527)-N(7))-methyltransferase RsmG
MPSDLITALNSHKAAFGLELPEETIFRFERYYGLLLEHNPILHLIGPMDAEEFAIRHLLESLMLLKHLPEDARFADVGSGGGLPSIPCLLAREDLSTILIESKEKKTKFLDLVVGELGLAKRAEVVNRQFQEADLGTSGSVTCRALDKLTDKLERLLRWSAGRQVLLFGGPNLREALQKQKVRFEERLMPLSNQRYLFVIAGYKPT